MKLHKIYKVVWVDAHSELLTTLDKFLLSKVGNTISVGYLVYEDNKRIVLSSEIKGEDKFKSDMTGDFTSIPKGWIKKRRVVNV